MESEEEAITTRDLQEDSKCTLQSLYIQMEYCEKSTLRNVIDEGLYKDQQRIWRLLREIVEGLVHVHSQVETFDYCLCKLYVCVTKHKKKMNNFRLAQ